MTADTVVFEAEEDGWHMIVTTSDGDRHDYRVHGIAWELALHARGTIGAWRAEGEAARGTGHVRLTEDDLDAYPAGSAKRVTLQRELDKQGGQHGS